MISRLAAVILLCTVYLIQTAEDPQQVPLTLAQLGGNVTLWCPVSVKEGKTVYWFKQPLGYMVQQVAVVILNRTTVSEQFKSRFTFKIEKAQYSLTIRNISKEDEATYFCFSGATYSSSFVSTFLAVKDRNQQRSFYVKQSPLTESVQPGDSVTLQCSLVSRNKGDRVQCPGEHSVHWFRSGSGESHPGFIHTHSDAQEERSCDFSLSKTINTSSDTGTYYCAVATCGEILFGEGTNVDTRSGSELDPVVLVLGVLLACCLIVIVIFIFYRNQRNVCKNCKGAESASHHPGHDGSTVDQSNAPFLQDAEAKGVNYAGLDFSTRKVKGGKRKKSESPQEYEYSAVRACDHNQQHPCP